MTSIDRRTFVTRSAALGAAIATHPRRLVYRGEHSVPVSSAFDLEEATIAQLQDGLASGAHTARSLAKHRLDAFVAPTGAPAWTTDLLNGDHFTGGYSTPSAVAGYPAITVPAGFDHGLPVGISFLAGAWSEPTLLRLAYAFEQKTRIRRAPAFLPTASL